MKIIKSDSKSVTNFIKPFLPTNPIIVEAGAFTGRDTLVLSSQWPQGIIHAFEPVPEIFNELKETTAGTPNVVCYPAAVSDTSGITDFFPAHHPDRPAKLCQAGSLHQPNERLTWSPIRYGETIKVTTTRLDDWAKMYNIDKIDFLWLDTQGHALAALQGTGELIKTIKIIYLEIEFIHAYQKQSSFDEVVEWLNNHDFYEIARDFHEQTSWFFGNLIMMKK